MSTNNEQKAIEALVDAIKLFQDSVDFFDTTAATVLGINETDLRCITALKDRGPMKASEVAVKLGLTRGATTTALNRLQERGYLSRGANENDGRGVIIELTLAGRTAIDTIWGPMRKKGGEHLRSYSIQQLQFLRLFFERSVELQTSCAEQLQKRAK